MLMIDLNKIKICGRYIITNDELFIFNGGSSLSFKMKGQSFEATLSSCPIDSFFYVIIDRDFQNKIKAKTSSKFVYSFKDNKEHYIDIVKANEANDCVIKLIDLSINGALLDYDYIYDKKVKVYGDSTIAGFGILEHDGVGSITNSDSVRDFCFQALYELNYEMDIMSASGWGLAFSMYTCPKHLGISDFQNKVATNKNDEWKNDKADLLIISLGTNDNSFIQEATHLKDALVKEFITKYEGMIDKELKYNPDLKILMVYGTLNEEDAYYLNEEAYSYLKPLYKNLYIHKFNGDNTAISNHAYVAHHSLMAEELKQVIQNLYKK